MNRRKQGKSVRSVSINLNRKVIGEAEKGAKYPSTYPMVVAGDLWID